MFDVEPEEAPAAKLSSRAVAPPAYLPTSLRLQQYHARFEEYKDTWEFSASLQRLLQENIQGKIIIGALFLRPFLVKFPLTGSEQPALQFSPQLAWFRLRAQTKLERLMLALATAVDV
jgi:hypothetical protein